MSAGPAHHWRREAIIVLRAVAPRPVLWWPSLAVMGRLARTGWWHRAPFLPLPGDEYWHFRLVTAFGGSGDAAAMNPADVVAYLRWCRRARPRRG